MKRRDRTIFPVYDLATAPPSYEFISFLCISEMARQVAGLDLMHILIVPGPNNGFRGDKKPISIDANIWRKDHIVAPACRLIDATYSYLSHPSEMEEYEQEHLWQPAWTLDYRTTWYSYKIALQFYESGFLIPELRSCEWADKKVSEWIDGPYVTITLRKSHGSGRNSHDDVWDEFAGWVRNQGYRVVVIPDTNDAVSCDPIGAIASIDLQFRHSLYKGAVTNFGVNTGPMALCMYSQTPYVMCHMVSEDWRSTSVEYLSKSGMPPGSQVPWATDKQRLVWEDESLPMLKREFEHQIAMRAAA